MQSIKVTLKALRVTNMISIVKIMEGESNTDKFTFKQKDAVGVRPSYQNTKVLKQLGIMTFAVTDLC